MPLGPRPATAPTTMPVGALAAVRHHAVPVAALAVTLAASVAFALVTPQVSDLFAARARASAAAHGVGLHYWFSWFSGIVPGNYSVLTPWLYQLVDPAWLGAVGTVLAVALCQILLRGSRHPAAATWCAALVAALLAVRAARSVPAVLAAVLAALISPVTGALLAVGVAGVVLHDRRRRRAAVLCAAAAAGCVVAVGIYFGMPGPQGYPLASAVLGLAAAAALLLARPPAAVRTVLLLTLVLIVVLAVVPNGMGSNVGRMAWVYLPVAVVATGRVPAWRSLTAAAVGVAVAVGFTVSDLALASRPNSSPASYAGLIAELRATPGLADHRVQVAADGTSTAALALLNTALLPIGFETQAQHRYNRLLDSPDLDAAGYRHWLDANAVAYVALSTHPQRHTAEDRLIRWHRPDYLRRAWSDADWVLFAVRDPVPLVDAPARVLQAGQARLRIWVPASGRYLVRVHWSRFLHATQAGASLQPAPGGWTVLIAPAAGRVEIAG